MITFNFDDTNIKLLRDKVNEIVGNMLKKQHNLHKNKTNSWNQICGIMDRIQDTLGHINTITLGNYPDGNRNCFDFCEFIMHVSVIIDSINWLAEIFDTPKEKKDKIINSCSCFHNKGYTKKGNDKKFFEYLRSLVVAHPIETSRHPDYIPNKDIMHICPFVLSSQHPASFFTKRKKIFDYNVVVYVSSSPSAYNKHWLIEVKSIVKYLNKWLNFLKDIIVSIDEYNEKVDTDLKNKKILTENEFANYEEYLNNLIKESTERFDSSYILTEALKLLNTRTRYPENFNLVNKYKEAIKLAIKEFHIILQQMRRNDDLNCLLYFLINPPLGNIEKYKDNEIYYANQKLSYLDGTYSYYNELWARKQTETHLFPIIKDQGLKIDTTCSNGEYRLLYYTALFNKSINENTKINAIFQ